MLRPLGAAVCMGFLAAGCGVDVGGPPNLDPMLGVIAWDDPPPTLAESANLPPGEGWGEGNWGSLPALQVPETVHRATPFPVQATTALPNGCWNPGDHELEVAGNVATITVYDHRTDSEVCTLVFSWKTREIEIQFPEAGEARVRMVGRRIAGDDFGGGEEIVIERTLVVH